MTELYHEADIPCDRVREPPHMLRDSIDPERLGQLADSIAAEGQHQRVGVYQPDAPDFYTLIYGHRRLLAHRLLGRLFIPAKIYPPDCDVLLIAASENLNREQLTPMEEAETCQKFVARNESVAGIARLFRRSPGWVASRLRLLTLPPELQLAVHSGEIGVHVAELLQLIDHDEYRQSLLTEAIRTGATAATVNVWVAHWRADPARYAANHSTVEEIRSNREKFVFLIECAGCQTNTPYGETRALRLCPRCHEALTAAAAPAGS